MPCWNCWNWPQVLGAEVVAETAVPTADLLALTRTLTELLPLVHELANRAAAGQPVPSVLAASAKGLADAAARRIARMPHRPLLPDQQGQPKSEN